MADVKIVDIDGSQWSMKDQEARDKTTTLETSVGKLQEKTELTELDDVVLNPVITFNGTVIKMGKLVIISGSIRLNQNPSGAYISNLPINRSAKNKDCIVAWTDYNGNNLGHSILSFDRGRTAISIGAGSATSYPAIGQLNLSYITE